MFRRSHTRGPRGFIAIVALASLWAGCTKVQGASAPIDAGHDGADAGSASTDGSGGADDANDPTSDASSPPADTGNAPTDSGSTATPDAAPVDAGPPPTPTYQTLTVAQLGEWMKSKDFLLINVHVPFQGAIIGTDKHIKYTKIDDLEAWLGHDKSAKAVLYCMTGPMSVYAIKKLMERGYWNLWDVPKGMIGWKAAGHSLDMKKP